MFFFQFKASQRVGELNTVKLQIVPKLSRGEIQSIKGSEKKKAAQFEVSFYWKKMLENLHNISHNLGAKV